MNEGQLTRRLIEKNTWWSDPDWQRDDPDLRPLHSGPLDYQPNPLADIAPDGLYVLVGPRRVGKSVELKRAIAGLLTSGVIPQRIVYFSCDSLRAADVRTLLRRGRSMFPAVAGARYWFIDEVTALPGWHAVIKDDRDTTPLREDCVVLTGSSSIDLQAGVADLAGRHGSNEATPERLLLPMSFRSFCHITSVALPLFNQPPLRPRDVFGERPVLEVAQVWWPALADAWENYLRIGGYPRAVADFLSVGDVRAPFVRDLWDVVRGEAFRTMRSSPPEALALFGRLSRSLSSTVNLSDLARDVGLSSNKEAEARISDLVTSFLGFRCYQDDNGRPNMNAQRKFYFTDPLLARLAHLLDSAYPEPDVSAVSEQQIGLALHRAVERERHAAFIELTEIRYWINRVTRAEIDFVGGRLGIGYESKYVDAGWRGESRTLAARGVGGVVATRSAFALDEDMVAIPTGLLAYLLSD